MLRSHRRGAAVVLALLLLALAAAPALAQGMIVPIDPPMPPRPPEPWPPGPAGLTMQSLAVEARVESGVAQVKVSQRYANRGQVNAEGTYVFPLPAGAAIRSFRMFINGEPLGGELLTAEEARRIYEGIVAQSRDPALLQYVGGGAISARVFPVPPGEERTIELEYSQVVPREDNLYALALPAGGAPEVAVTAFLETREPLTTVYSPTHSVSVQRDGNFKATVGFEGAGGRQSQYLQLYYGVGGGEVTADLLTYAAPGEPGYFLLLVNPQPDTAAAEIQAKDVILVLDTSGSMEGRKLAQAKGALTFVLQRLNREDRFGLIAFDSGINPYSDTLEPASAAQSAMDWVAGLSARGSTHISGALAEAQRMAAAGAQRDRPQMIVFLTDGLPTVGLRTPGEILEQTRQAGGDNLRIFPFGVGFDVNTLLLDGLAVENRGISTYVQPSEDLEEKVAAFYRKVAAPVLSNITLQVEGVQVRDPYPQPLGDLFAGSQLVITGRYTGHGSGGITVSGTLNGRHRTFRFSGLEFPERETGRDFVARLWAGRKIAWLLNQIRLYGASDEVVDEVVQLSLRHGIMTPYTSFLIQEPGMALDSAADEFRNRAAARPPSGASAVTDSSAVGGLNQAESLQAQKAAAPATPSGSAPAAEYLVGSGDMHSPVRTAGDKTFILTAGVWTDTAYAAGAPAQPVAFGSSAYFTLAAGHGRYLAVGLPLVVVIDGQAYRIEDTGAPAEPGTGGPLPDDGSAAGGAAGGDGDSDAVPPAGGQGSPARVNRNFPAGAAWAVLVALGGAGALSLVRRGPR